MDSVLKMIWKTLPPAGNGAGAHRSQIFLADEGGDADTECTTLGAPDLPYVLRLGTSLRGNVEFEAKRGGQGLNAAQSDHAVRQPVHRRLKAKNR